MNVVTALKHLEIELTTITKKDVKSAYRRLMLIWHPDKHFGEAAIKFATAKAQDLNNSYEALSLYFEDQDTLTNYQIGAAHKNSTDSQWSAPRSSPRPAASREYSQSSASSRRRRFWHDIVEHGFPDETVFEVFFESSHLVSAGYDATRSILYQKFLEGSGSVVYRYFSVPEAIWQGLQEAQSHGKYAIKNINYSFRYERCSEPNRPYNPLWRFDHR